MPVAAIVVLAVLTLLVQLGRRTAQGAAAKRASDRDDGGLVARVRGAWRQLCLAVFGLDLPREQVEALATTSFAAKQGMIGILGPNGAGKTTLLRLLAAVLDPTAGAVHYSGRLKRRVGDYVSRWVGYLPQEFGLPDHLTAQEYLDYFALLYEVGNVRERRERVDTLLAEVGLGERKHEKIGGYSGGMRQRVAVARTLLRQPPIIIVDEPTVGLDPRERIRFRNLLAKLAEGRVVLVLDARRRRRGRVVRARGRHAQGAHRVRRQARGARGDGRRQDLGDSTGRGRAARAAEGEQGRRSSAGGRRRRAPARAVRFAAASRLRAPS